eukprot:scaffold35079_cov88-Skeletonema_marinoi.AAC.1
MAVSAVIGRDRLTHASGSSTGPIKYLLRRATWENSFIAPTLGVLDVGNRSEQAEWANDKQPSTLTSPLAATHRHS